MTCRRTDALGDRLQRLRQIAGLSQQALAVRAGIGVATIAALEEGRRKRPYPNTMAALANALELAPADRAALLDLASATKVDHPRLTDAASHAQRPSTHEARLPLQPTPLIGREAELGVLGQKLDPLRSEVRLLSLLGPGGVGKTRLSIAAASALVDAYPDGVAFVDLAPLRDHRLVPATVAQALGVRESDGRSARELLLEQLRDRRLLLVLDNFEHVLEARSLVADLLSACAALRVLVTSRTALRLRSEHRYTVKPFACDDADVPLEILRASPAVRLFVARAQAALPEFALSARNARVINAICRRVDGIPLAIELAAARIDVLSPATLLARLEHGLSLLASGAADLPARQRSVRATLMWSADLLRPEERRLFQRLAVFAADWTVEAAQAVCGEPDAPVDSVLEQIRGLVDSSLIQRRAGADEQQRFSMLATVREYALEGLASSGDLDATIQRFLGWSVNLVQPATRNVPEPATILRQRADYSNLRAALGYAVEREAVEQGLWLAVGLTGLWFVSGTYAEGRAWLDALLRMPGANVLTAARAYALAAAGHLAHHQGEHAVAEELLHDAQTLNNELRDEFLAAAIEHFLANTVRQCGDLVRATTLYASCADSFERLGDATWLASALVNQALTAVDQGDLQRATELAQRGLVLFQASGNTWGGSRALRVLGRVAAKRGDRAQAQHFHEASLALDREMGDTHSQVLSLVALADDALAQADPQAALGAYVESLKLAHRSGNLLFLARSLEGLARNSPPSDRRVAVRLAGSADAVRMQHGSRRTAADQRAFEAWLESARGELGSEGFTATWAAGIALTLPEAVAEGLQMCSSPRSGSDSMLSSNSPSDPERRRAESR